MWTRFMDMHSGGGYKEKPYNKIYIEASEDEAKVIFYNRFGHNPQRVTCTCCGEDYSISEYATLEEASNYDRKEAARQTVYEKTRKYIPFDDKNITAISLDEYKKFGEVLIVDVDQIKETERAGEVPEQGYVWKD